MIKPLPRVRLWAEFLVLFGGVPITMAIFFGQYPLFPMILAFTILAMVLLARTPDFDARELLRGPVLGQWKLIAAFTLVGVILTFGVALALVPERFLELPRQRPALWLMIMLLYPLVSALPQELMYRVLFFAATARYFAAKSSRWRLMRWPSDWPICST